MMPFTLMSIFKKKKHLELFYNAHIDYICMMLFNSSIYVSASIMC